MPGNLNTTDDVYTTEIEPWVTQVNKWIISPWNIAPYMRIESRKHPRSVFIFIKVVYEIHDTAVVCNKRTFICVFILFILYRAFFWTRTTGTQEGVSCQNATLGYGIDSLVFPKIYWWDDGEWACSRINVDTTDLFLIFQWE